MKCIGIGRLLGHNYQPRYDTTESPHEVDGWTIAMRSGFDDLHSLLTLTTTTYRGDVCTRCGNRLDTLDLEAP